MSNVSITDQIENYRVKKLYLHYCFFIFSIPSEKASAAI